MRLQNIHVLSLQVAIFSCYQGVNICLSKDPIVKALLAVLFSKRQRPEVANPLCFQL